MKRSTEVFLKEQGIKLNQTILPEQSIAEAAEVISSSGNGAALVCKNGYVHGIVTEHDIVKYIAENISVDIECCCVKDIMSKNIIYATPEYSLEQCLLVMTTEKINNLPILDESSKKLVAFLNIRQISSILVKEQESEILELTRYISGSTGIIHSPDKTRFLSKDGLQFNIHSFLL